MKAVPRPKLRSTFKEVSRPSLTSIWTRTSIFNNWNSKFLKQTDIWGLYWQCTDFKDIHRLFKIPYDELMHILYVLSKEMNLSYADMNDMAFFEILTILDVYKENMEEQQKQSKQENDMISQQMNNMLSNYNMNNVLNQMNNMQMPSFTPPSISMPKI